TNEGTQITLLFIDKVFTRNFFSGGNYKFPFSFQAELQILLNLVMNESFFVNEEKRLFLFATTLHNQL
ncbi:hypothetical protein, partial [Bacteroides sp. Ga6A1]|uniref:hypothetical protein n=1 Tax=Bacteroides sp. Ga6A1 TaxID=1410607 RepID=UPI0004E188ED